MIIYEGREHTNTTNHTMNDPLHLGKYPSVAYPYLNQETNTLKSKTPGTTNSLVLRAQCEGQINGSFNDDYLISFFRGRIGNRKQLSLKHHLQAEAEEGLGVGGQINMAIDFTPSKERNNEDWLDCHLLPSFDQNLYK